MPADTTYEEWKKKFVDIDDESDIINEKSKKSITAITDNAIDRVPNVSISGLTDTQNAFIQEQHKELLRYARDNNENKEVAFVYNSDLEKIGTYVGSDDTIDFGNALYGKDLTVLHNHPRNSSYSITDMQFFLTHNNVKTLTIIKNTGNAEVLTKTSNFDEQQATTVFKRVYKTSVKANNDTEVSKAISKFLTKYREGLIWEK